MKIKDHAGSHLLVLAFGVLAGILTLLLNLCPADTLFSFSSIASAFGFWMITVTLVIYYSQSNAGAALHVFLYLESMTIVFYVGQGILGFFLPQFSYGSAFLNWRLFGIYSILSLVCAVGGYVLYFWNGTGFYREILYALPLCGLGGESIGVLVFFCRTHTYLFQLLLDVAGLIWLGCLFYRRVERKVLFLATAVLGSAAFALLFYLPVI